VLLVALLFTAPSVSFAATKPPEGDEPSPQELSTTHASDKRGPWAEETTYEWLSLNPLDGRLIRRWALRFDIGCGGGPDALAVRAALGAEVRLTPHWGIGAWATGDIRGLYSAARGLGAAEVRGFWETSVPEGWIRLEGGVGPALVGNAYYDCGSPLCGSQPATIGAAAVISLETAYLFPHGAGQSMGPAVRVQFDSRLDVIVTANFSLSVDVLSIGAPGR
jgi:hypothetical protein